MLLITVIGARADNEACGTAQRHIPDRPLKIGFAPT